MPARKSPVRTSSHRPRSAAVLPDAEPADTRSGHLLNIPGMDRLTESIRSLDFGAAVKRNPVLMMAAAAGVGFLFGGRGLMRLGLRAAAVPGVRGELLDLFKSRLHGQ